MRTYKIIPITQLTEPADPMRFEMSDEFLLSLCDSIKAQGILEPLCVRPDHVFAKQTPNENNEIVNGACEVLEWRYEVIAGHRRLIAARMAGLAELPCIVFEGEDADATAIMIAENIEREDVTAFEEGALYCKIADIPGMTEERLKAVIKKPLGYIYTRIDLMRGDPNIAQSVQRKQINLGVARELNKVKHDGYRGMYLERAIQGGCTIELAKSWVSQWRMADSGLSEAQKQPLEPLPGPEHIAQPQACWLCHENSDPWNLEPVWIHRQELHAMRMAQQMHAERAAAAGDK
jgi:ParB/RepB/Spo0J family partition protein